MTVLADHVTRSVAIAVFGIIVCALVQQGREDLGIATSAGNMERCAQVLGLAVDVGTESGEDVYHVDVALIAGHMKRGPAVRIALIEQCLSKLRILLCQQVLALLILPFFSIDPNVAEQATLLFLILLSLGLVAHNALYLLLF